MSIAPISVQQGDITTIKVDAIVNAANKSLMGGGGVDGAIHRAGGPEILEACKNIISKNGPCPTGEAVITGAGKLPARFVIHTVGPVWTGGLSGESKLLKNAYSNSLKLGLYYQIESMAFPNISTGVYGYPKEEAASIAVDTVTEFIKNNNRIKKVIFVCFDIENYKIYRDLIVQ